MASSALAMPNTIPMIEHVKDITARISLSAFGTNFSLRVEHDNQNPAVGPPSGRIFLQVI